MCVIIILPKTVKWAPNWIIFSILTRDFTCVLTNIETFKQLDRLTSEELHSLMIFIIQKKRSVNKFDLSVLLSRIKSSLIKCKKKYFKFMTFSNVSVRLAKNHCKKRWDNRDGTAWWVDSFSLISFQQTDLGRPLWKS